MIARLMFSSITTLAMLVLVCLFGREGWAPSAPAVHDGPGPKDVMEPSSDRIVAERRVVTYPGAEVAVAAEIAGMIVRLPVRERTVSAREPSSRSSSRTSCGHRERKHSRVSRRPRCDSTSAKSGVGAS
jgi:hypothetical protein